MASTAKTGTIPTGAAALLAVLALVFGIFLTKDRLVEPPPVSASLPFDTTRAFARLERILGDQRPHPVDTEANDAVRERLLAEITALGHEPEVRDDFACRSSLKWGSSACARVRNVIFRMGPPGGNAILVASHYDSVPAGPGASDDGAGVAASLEIAALLKTRVLQRPVIFLITEGEELALLGAASFVRKDPYAKDVARS
jgi:acetylornithine deacetylase/succinyl-diaminopimelate desuccinylase-like protein